MVTILVVEDDKMVRLLTKARLSGSYHVLEAENGKEALEVMDHHHVDLIILDIQMPEMNGYELVRELRSCDNAVPVIMLTAMTTFKHKKEGFASGADDYMTKPINYEELSWRIEALLRRAKISNEKKIQIGRFCMEESSYKVSFGEKIIPFTNKEFELLYKLLSYPGKVFTKQQLMDEIWGYDTDTEYDTIKTYISKLRNKCSMCHEFDLIAIRGLGYKAVLTKEEK